MKPFKWQHPLNPQENVNVALAGLQHLVNTLDTTVLYLIANHCVNPLGNRCGLNFEIVHQIIIKQFSKVLRTYKPRSVGILMLNRWMLIDFLKFPTCKTPFIYTPINLCINFYYCTSHMTWLHVCLPFSKLLNWGMPGRQQLLINDCLNEGLLTNDCIPTKQAFCLVNLWVFL